MAAVLPSPWRAELKPDAAAGVAAAANLLEMLVYAIDVIFVAASARRSWRPLRTAPHP
ncbi:MAG: hypothetical protein JF593_01545 [Novosphingobium sp.]|nr:hypothetical protein [Novosphingobium sp.]